MGALITAGKFREAADICTRLLLQRPADAQLLHYAGIASEHLGDHAAALKSLLAARHLAPQDSSLHNHLGIVYESLNQFQDAASAYEQALRLSPDLADAHSNLASLLVKQSKPEEALKHASIAAEKQPGNPLTWVALGDANEMLGNHGAAIAAYKHAIEGKNPPRRAFTSLAMIYLVVCKYEDAIDLLTKARTVFGDDPLILNDLGLAFGNCGRLEEAQALFELAYSQLHETTTLYNIVMNLTKLKRWGDILALESEILSHPQPNTAIPPLFAAAVNYNDFGLEERLLPHFLEWCEHAESKFEAAGQNAVMLMPVPTVSPLVIRNLLERCAQRHAERSFHKQFAFDHCADSERHGSKIRVGYLSGDFRMHVVNYFISGQLSHYDKQHFEVFCYSSAPKEHEDEITDQYRHAVDRFINIEKMALSDLASQISSDGIHILIDLSGHTAGTRLDVMTYRPAPVQASYLGYPFTTGLKQVDYYLADHFLNGPGNQDYFTEQIVEISSSYITGGKLPISPSDFTPPITRNGYVSFGTLNNPYKLNRRVIATWSEILAAVPNSILVLNHPNYSVAEARQNVIEEFNKYDIEPERIKIAFERHPSGSNGAHLHFYEDIDIALDTFPLTGGTTTYEALWMGVPVVTLVGNSSYQRLSYTFLRNCGTDSDDLTAHSEAEFVSKTIALATDRDRIAALHFSIGRSIRESVLCDPARQVRLYEDALIDAWNRKFPEHPKFTSETFTYTRLDTPAAPLVATVSDPDNLDRYVIEEQGRWFAPEYGLLKRLAEHLDGMAVDIGAEPGFFSLELARTGMHALSLSTSAIASRLIRAAAEKDGHAERIEVRLESARSNLLDRAELENVALLRIGTEANDGNAGPAVKNPSFWKNNAPVVLLSVHCGNQTDLSTAERLTTMGYRLYRLLPGLECFAPHQVGEILDPYTLYLLACPGAREPALIAAGLLVPEPEAVAPEEAAGLSTANQTVDPWQQMDEWIIRCASQANASRKESSVRLGYLHLAIKAQQTLIDGAPSTTRRITLARLLSDIGRRAEAVNIFNQALAEIEQGTAQVTLPFLAPSATWDEIDPGDHLAEWLFAALIETRCRLAAHSTYFLSKIELESLDTITSFCFDTAFSKGSQRARLARQSKQIS